jgi:hypothetical protein
MLTRMKSRLLQLQKSANDSAWGMGVELGNAGPGLTSTSPEEQRKSRIVMYCHVMSCSCSFSSLRFPLLVVLGYLLSLYLSLSLWSLSFSQLSLILL